jgi:DNA-directed RNA polymerase subunit RPC12/RpoP
MDRIKTYSYSRARHKRFVFLVDRTATSEFLREIFIANYELWGGKFNPIIPVTDSLVDENFVQLMEQYDPDIIYYMEGFDLTRFQGQGIKVYPESYEELTSGVLAHLPGVYSYQFLQHYFSDPNKDRSVVTLVNFSHQQEQLLTWFFKVNFGVTNQFYGDEAYSAGFNIHTVASDDIHNTISYLNPSHGFYRSMLSSYMLCSAVLTAEDNWEANNFELIVYRDQDAFDDLLYYWNRQLYQKPEEGIKQVAISLGELEELLENNWLGSLLKYLSRDTSISLTSRTIKGSELEDVAILLKAKVTHLNVQVKKSSLFPYGISRTTIVGYGRRELVKHLLKGEEDFVEIRKPDLKTMVLSGEFQFDVRITQHHPERGENHFRFPSQLLLNGIVSDQPGRVDMFHNLTFSVDEDVQGIDITIPDPMELLKRRMVFRKIGSSIVKAPIEFCQISSAGQKLSAFMKLFEQDLNLVSHLITDAFWLEILLGNSTAKKTDLACLRDKIAETKIANFTMEESGDKVLPQTAEKIFQRPDYIESNFTKGLGIFSVKDVETHLRLTYYLRKREIAGKIALRAPKFKVTDVFIEKSIQEDMQEVSRMIDIMVNKDILFMGLKVKCSNCGSNLWYSLQQLSNTMACNGCGSQVSPRMESSFYYKVNDVVLNNLMSDPVKRTKEFYGNYVVLLTLISLKEDMSRAYHSFNFSPCLDIHVIGDNFSITDLDIIALQNGELIVGEAKMSATSFTKGQLAQLIWIGKNIKPDKVVLAYKEGKVSQKIIDELSQGIGDRNVEILLHQISEPLYGLGRLSGLPATKGVEKN